MSYEDIWVNLKPKEVKEYIKQCDGAEKAKIQLEYNLVWLAAMYSHISVHNPKAFPSKPIQIFREEENQNKPAQTEEEQNAVIDFLLS